MQCTHSHAEEVNCIYSNYSCSSSHFFCNHPVAKDNPHAAHQSLLATVWHWGQHEPLRYHLKNPTCTFMSWDCPSKAPKGNSLQVRRSSAKIGQLMERTYLHNSPCYNCNTKQKFTGRAILGIHCAH